MLLSLFTQRISKTALLCLAVLVLFNISCKRDVRNFRVIVNNKDLDYPVRLQRVDTSGLINVDSLLNPTGGNFSFKVQAHKPYVYILRSGDNQVTFMATSGDVIQVDFSKNQMISGENERYKSFSQFLYRQRSIEKEADSLAEIYRNAQLTDSFPAIRERLNESFNDLLVKDRIIAEEFIKNDTSPAIFYALTSKLRQSIIFRYEMNPYIFYIADSVMRNRNPEHPYTMWINNFMRLNKVIYGDLLETSFGIKQGEVFPDFQLPGLDKRMMSISPEKGKLTLIYLWDESSISRKSTLTIKSLDEKYKDSGLKIYAIAFIDSKAKWSSLIEIDKMWWANLIDEHSYNSPLLKDLKIRRLPYFIMLDGNRKVEAAFASAAELNDWVRTKFK